jgi:integrase
MNLTIPSSQRKIVFRYNLGGEFMERGSILCAAPRCGRVRKDNEKACACGHDAVYIRVGWQGRQYRYYQFMDAQGRLLAYSNAQAIIVLREINHKIDAGTFTPAAYLTASLKTRIFGNAYEAWLDTKEKLVNREERSPETLRCYQSYYRNYLGPYFAAMDVSQITDNDLDEFLEQLPDRLSQKYRKNIMKATEAFLRWTLKKHYINALPVIPVITVKSARKIRAIPYDLQMYGINNIPEEHRDIYLFIRETALRISEACAIKAVDIDFPGRRALICRNISGNKIQNTTKGGEAKPIPLSVTAIETLRRNITDLKGYVFTNPVTGRPYMPEFLRRLWVEKNNTGVMLKEAMRHSTISDWANSGASANQLKELGRHADIRTSDIYVHNAMQGLYSIVDRKVINIAEVKARKKKA